jgi:hypothetical protein
MPTGDPDIDQAFSGNAIASAGGLTGDADIDAAFKASTAKPEEPTLHELEARGDQLGQEPVDLYGQKYPWGSVGRSVVGAVTNLAGLIPFAGGGISESIRKHTQSVQPHNIGEEIGAGGISGTLPLLAMGMGAKAKATPSTAEEVLANQAAGSRTNMGAAAAAPSLANVSPELKQAIVTAAQKTGGAVPADVLARHLEADSLPVKIKLTDGQASQDPNILSNEVNSRGRNPALAQRYNQQNEQLGQNIQVLRDKVGPDVFSTNQVEHGDTLIQAYKDKDAAVQADINQKYQALRDANGSTMPIDTGTLVANIDAQLKKQYLTDSVPSQAQSILNSLRNGEPMDFEGFEAARTRLAEAQRGGGSEAKAASIIRDNLEQMPLDPAAAGLKGLADTARSAAKARFQALESDPAYSAAVNGTIPPERFTSRFVLNGTRDNIATMKQNLAGNDVAQQTIGVSALDQLRDQAKVGPGQSGNFAAESYNKALNAIGPKNLFDQQTSETLSSLGNVARNVKGQPAGAYVNNSNTFVSQAAEHAKNALEGAANVAAKGVPVGTWVRKAAQSRAAAKETERALAPGAGLSRLSDISKK